MTFCYCYAKQYGRVDAGEEGYFGLEVVLTGPIPTSWWRLIRSCVLFMAES